MKRDGLRFEIVFVNDGSRDDTLGRLLDRSAADRRMRVVNLSRNFGKEAALTAGIDHARGDIIDPDGHRPAGSAGADRRRSWRAGARATTSSTACAPARTWDTAAKRLSAGWFYRVFNSMSPVRIPANVGDFRLVDRRAVEVLRQLPERNRFMKGLFAWVGFNAHRRALRAAAARRRARASSICGGCGTSPSTAW